MKTYLVVYFGSVLLALICTPLVIFFARAFKVYDSPNVRKIHASSIPRIGGVAIVLSMLGLMIPVLLLNNAIGEVFRQIQFQVIVLLAGALLMFFVGLLDDLYHLRVWIKLLAQLGAAIFVCSFGIRIATITVADWCTLDFGWLSWPITIFWIVGITNAVNLTDGLDGLAAGICAITCGVIAVIAIYTNQIIMAVLMLALLGSLTGFLFFNFNPAKIFMGDSGSLFLGFTLAVSSVISATKSATLVGIALPILALGVPIFDTLFSMLRRFLERRSMFSPDRGHLHHLLLDMGLHQRQAVLLIYLVTFVIAGLGMLMMATHNAETILIFAGILFLLILLFRWVGVLKVREIIVGLQRHRSLAVEANKLRRSFDTAQLHIRCVESFDQWWRAVQSSAEKMGFTAITLPLRNRDGTEQTLIWHSSTPGELPCSKEVVNVTLPVSQRRADETLRIALSIPVGDSLESAGRRATLFGRLIDENGLDKIPPDILDAVDEQSIAETVEPVSRSTDSYDIKL